MVRRRGASITEILGILGALVVLVAIISYGMGWLNSGNQQANKLTQGTGQLLSNTVDKMTAETFLNSLTFIWSVYNTRSKSVITSGSGSWNDLKATVENYANQKKITPVIVYADTNDPSKSIPVKAGGNIKLNPYASLNPVPSTLPFGYEAFYNILKANPNKNIYFVIGKSTDAIQIVVSTAYYQTS